MAKKPDPTEVLVRQGCEETLKTPQGRAFLNDILARCGIYRSSFNAQTPPRTFFREGERNIGLQVLALIHEAHPDAYHVMQKEARERDKMSERTRERDRDEQFGGNADDDAGDAGDE